MDKNHQLSIIILSVVLLFLGAFTITLQSQNFQQPPSQNVQITPPGDFTSKLDSSQKQSVFETTPAPIPPADPAKGMFYKGLTRGSGGSCPTTHFEIRLKNGYVFCTHGPDPGPPGVDVRMPKQPGFTLRAGGVSGVRAGAADTKCEGDGHDGKRVQLVYARASDREHRYEAFLPDFKRIIAATDKVFQDSAARGNGNRYIRFVHDDNCKPIIEQVILSETGDDSWDTILNEFTAQGNARNDRKYLIWLDSNDPPEGVCGLGGVYNDSKPGQDNFNNSLTGHGIIWNGCWGLGEVHELGHILGASQNDAPHVDSEKTNHTSDDQDYLYVKGPYFGNSCLLDCDHDDYFSLAPGEGSYLSNHWNIANSAFLGGRNQPSDSCPYKDLVLREGNEGEGVEDVQRRLKTKGYDLGSFGPNEDGIDGRFGSVTRRAVQQFQHDNGVEGSYCNFENAVSCDGIVGPYTWGALCP